MKDLEILENIDLHKILAEMRLRDKKLERLPGVDDDVNMRIETCLLYIPDPADE